MSPAEILVATGEMTLAKKDTEEKAAAETAAAEKTMSEFAVSESEAAAENTAADTTSLVLATSPMPEPASATETEPAEVAELVQARSLP